MTDKPSQKALERIRLLIGTVCPHSDGTLYQFACTDCCASALDAFAQERMFEVYAAAAKSTQRFAAEFANKWAKLPEAQRDIHVVLEMSFLAGGGDRVLRSRLARAEELGKEALDRLKRTQFHYKNNFDGGICPLCDDEEDRHAKDCIVFKTIQKLDAFLAAGREKE